MPVNNDGFNDDEEFFVQSEVNFKMKTIKEDRDEDDGSDKPYSDEDEGWDDRDDSEEDKEYDDDNNPYDYDDDQERIRQEFEEDDDDE